MHHILTSDTCAHSQTGAAAGSVLSTSVFCRALIPALIMTAVMQGIAAARYLQYYSGGADNNKSSWKRKAGPIAPAFTGVLSTLCTNKLDINKH